MNCNLMMKRTLGALLAVGVLVMGARPAGAQAVPYAVPESARVTYNFNPGWKFLKAEAPGAEKVDFDDSSWALVSTPHTYNDVDSFNKLISRSGQAGAYQGPAAYRKHFRLPAAAQGSKVFIEFEGMRQAAKFYLNDKPYGKYENGVTATGIDITDGVFFGDKENVLTVKITNGNYVEESSRVGFQWEGRDFNPNYGGLNRNVWLHVMGKVYQTLPILDNLKTTGTYVYGSDIQVQAKTATVNVESQVRNESDGAQQVTISGAVVDPSGMLRATLRGETKAMNKGETAVLKASGALANARLWSPADPALYDVYSILSVGGKVVDVNKVTTGFRKVEFKGGAGTGGIYINDKFVYLKGYAIRTANEWAAVGGAYPEWMHDFSNELLRAGHGNYIRWMHIAPQPADVRGCDKYGIVQACPAGDKEGDVQGAQWDQRVVVMRDTIIYHRNSPSILMWEGGNAGITPAHMSQMVALRKELDPTGGRVMGCRTLNDPGTTNLTEYFGTMVAQDARTEQLNTPTAMFRAFSYQRRDIAPFVETEDFRDEAARRFWDDFSPPHFGFKQGPEDTYNLNSETFCLAAATRYWDFYSNRISNSDPKHARWSGYASIIFADSNQHGRQASSEVCRTSGKVDAVRIPKQAYYVYRVMQNEAPDTHIIGHWNYPANTKKTVYVAANNVDSVELFVNGASKGKNTSPKDGYIYAFPNIGFEPGTIKTVGTKAGQAVSTHEIKTVGPAAAVKLTTHVGPKGLLADGGDVAFFDVEIVDAAGNRCPTDEGRVDFELSGPAIWRGGYNSGKVDSTNKTYLDTECGINRVFVRSSFTAGVITLKATRAGLPPATVTLTSAEVPIKFGLLAEKPPGLPSPAAMPAQ